MNQSKTARRRQRGEEYGLAIRIAQEVKGKVLAAAYVTVKSAGLQLRINKFDGVPHGNIALTEGKEAVSVDVVNGVVTKSWIG